MSAYMHNHLKKIGAMAIDFLLPPLCPATGEMVDALGMVDASYWKTLNFIHGPFCKTCGTPFSFEVTEDLECGNCLDTPPKYHQNRSALYYDDGCRSLILKFKHGDQTHAVKAFIPWLRQTGDELIAKADIILPVPLHRMRLIKRRFNQAELMARELCTHYPHIAYYPDGLLRIKQTQSQGHKKATDRISNVRKAFAANPDHIYDGKNILIIDDVFTTGATLNECCKTLYKAGAKEVNCLTLAKVIQR